MHAFARDERTEDVFVCACLFVCNALQTSSNHLDLRFIPDDMSFLHDPKDVCESTPEDYEPSLFVTNVLQETDITLTWEQDDGVRTSFNVFFLYSRLQSFQPCFHAFLSCSFSFILSWLTHHTHFFLCRNELKS